MGGEALVWLLHAGYAFVPLAFLVVAAGTPVPGAGDAMGTGAQHVWMAGGIGLMTLAIMTRASLGHAGRPLHAGPAVTALHLLIVVSALARFAAGLAPGAMGLLNLAGARGSWPLAALQSFTGVS